MEDRRWGPLDGLLTGGRDVWLIGWLTSHRIPISCLVAHSSDWLVGLTVIVSANCWAWQPSTEAEYVLFMKDKCCAASVEVQQYCT
eukprot:349619-Pelagomonas_calceolata.AAC.1